MPRILSPPRLSKQRSTTPKQIDTMHPRIEKAAFRKGEYIGYCNGAQRIRKGGQGWRTYELGSAAGTFVSVTAPTLRQLGDKLDKLAHP